MLISVDLQGIDQLTEYQDREVAVVSRLESALESLRQEAEMLSAQDMEILCRQIAFAKKELRQIQDRKAILQKAYVSVSSAKRSYAEKLATALRWLNGGI